MERVYFDHNATAPLAPEVLEEMLPFMHGRHGNAASSHQEGRRMLDAVEHARARVAAAVNARPQEVVFTSSGTESNNTIVKGVPQASGRKVIVTSAIEHPCVHCAARAMARQGCKFIPVAVDAQGELDIADLQTTVDAGDTAIVSVMLANNETGVLQDIAKVASVAKAAGAVVHSDCAQALGKVPIDFAAMGADAITLSAHKARGPMGVAALVFRQDLAMNPLLEGGGQERGWRSGTLNVPGIVGFGKAAELAVQSMERHSRDFARLRDRFETQVMAAEAQVFSQQAARLPNTSYFGIPGIEGETLVLMLDQAGFAVASGSACASTKNEPSHVLLAMGLPEETVRTAARVSLGIGNDEAQVDALAAAVASIAERLSSMASALAS